MNRKEFLKLLKHPRGLFLIPLFLSTVGFGAGAIIATLYFPHAFLAYILYAVAAVLLGYSVYAFVLLVKSIKKAAALKMRKYKFTGALTENYGFRTAVFSGISVFLNVAFSIFNGLSAIIMKSVWHSALSGYYFALALVRCGVLAGGIRAKRISYGDEKAERLRKLSVQRAAGIVLLLLELVIPAAISRLLISSGDYDYLLLSALVSASYSFTKLTLAIINLVKAYRHGDPVIYSIRGINLTDALMSIMITQIMLVSYAGGEEDRYFAAAINICTGSSVCLVTAAIGIVMWVSANINIKRLRRSRTEITEPVTGDAEEACENDYAEKTPRRNRMCANNNINSAKYLK